MNEKKEKKTWMKPVCEKVKLVPEEAVLWGCKIILNASAPRGVWGTCVTSSSCPSAAS